MALTENEAVRSYIARHAPKILEQFDLVINTVTMEESLEQERQPNGVAATSAGADGAAAEATGRGHMA